MVAIPHSLNRWLAHDSRDSALSENTKFRLSTIRIILLGAAATYSLLLVYVVIMEVALNSHNRRGADISEHAPEGDIVPDPVIDCLQIWNSNNYRTGEIVVNIGVHVLAAMVSWAALLMSHGRDYRTWVHSVYLIPISMAGATFFGVAPQVARMDAIGAAYLATFVELCLKPKKKSTALVILAYATICASLQLSGADWSLLTLSNMTFMLMQHRLTNMYFVRFETLKASQEQALSMSLEILCDLLPYEMAVMIAEDRSDEIMGRPFAEANVACLFCDLVGFTRMCSKLSSRRAFSVMHRLFDAYDTLAVTSGGLKMETAGDAAEYRFPSTIAGVSLLQEATRLGPKHEVKYGPSAPSSTTNPHTVTPDVIQDDTHEDQELEMATPGGVLGAEMSNGNHDRDAVACINLGLDIQLCTAVLSQLLASATKSDAGRALVRVRCGVAFGELVSGVVGRDKPALLHLGPCIDKALLLEQTGVPGTVHIDRASYDAWKTIAPTEAAHAIPCGSWCLAKKGGLDCLTVPLYVAGKEEENDGGFEVVGSHAYLGTLSGNGPLVEAGGRQSRVDQVCRNSGGTVKMPRDMQSLLTCSEASSGKGSHFGSADLVDSTSQVASEGSTTYCYSVSNDGALGSVSGLSFLTRRASAGGKSSTVADVETVMQAKEGGYLTQAPFDPLVAIGMKPPKGGAYQPPPPRKSKWHPLSIIYFLTIPVVDPGKNVTDILNMNTAIWAFSSLIVSGIFFVIIIYFQAPASWPLSTQITISGLQMIPLVLSPLILWATVTYNPRKAYFLTAVFGLFVMGGTSLFPATVGNEHLWGPKGVPKQDSFGMNSRVLGLMAIFVIGPSEAAIYQGVEFALIFLYNAFWVSYRMPWGAVAFSALSRITVVALVVAIQRAIQSVSLLTAVVTERFVALNVLLQRLLPPDVAVALAKDPSAFICHSYEEVGLLFADISSLYDVWLPSYGPARSLELLSDLWVDFDALCVEHHCNTIECVRGEYLASCGAPEPNPDCIQNIAELAVAMRRSCRARAAATGIPHDVKIGINSGPITSGVLGATKRCYKFSGSAMNLTARTKSKASPGQILTTPGTEPILTSCGFSCQPLPELVSLKGLGEVQLYEIP